MKEIISRFLAQKPKFFKVLQIIGLVLTVICGLPEFLQSFGITLPESFMLVANKYIALMGAVTAFISQFTVSTPKATKEVLDKISSGTPTRVASNNA